MNVNISRQELVQALKLLSKVARNNQHVPILGCVLIEAKDDKVTISSTDLDSYVERDVVNPHVMEEGGVAIPARELSRIVGLLGGSIITIETQDDNAVVTSGNSRYNLLSSPASEFPPNNVKEIDKCIEIDSNVLNDALNSVLYAASKEENRAVLMGVYLEGKNDELRLVATDTHRLVYNPISLEGVPDFKAVVPANVMSYITDLGGKYKLSFDGQFRLSNDTTRVTARLLDGQYPNYEKVLVKGVSATVFCDKLKLIKALDRISVVAKESSSKVRVKVANNQLTLSAESVSIGTAKEIISVDHQGEIESAYNCGYLKEAVAHIKDEDVVYIGFNDPLNPIVVSAAGEGAQAIVMPMQI